MMTSFTCDIHPILHFPDVGRAISNATSTEAIMVVVQLWLKPDQIFGGHQYFVMHDVDTNSTIQVSQ